VIRTAVELQAQMRRTIVGARARRGTRIHVGHIRARDACVGGFSRPRVAASARPR
jgi:hypothetical protein